MKQDYRAVVVGVSAGGLDALSIVIPALEEDFPLPIAVVQHRRADSDDFLAIHLHEQSRQRVNHCRPSIDVLFESAADVYEQRLVGVILTGSNTDGSRGMKYIKQRGGLTVVQDPACAESDCMPRESIKAMRVDKILHIDDIGPFLTQCCRADNIHLTGTAAKRGS